MEDELHDAGTEPLLSKHAADPQHRSSPVLLSYSSCAEEASTIEVNATQEGEEAGGGAAEGKGAAEDWLGRPLPSARSMGGWKAAYFLLGAITLQFLALSGCSVNLVIFLVRELRQDNPSAANATSTWAGTCFLSSIVGGALGDSYWGRLRTSLFCQSLFVLGLLMFAIIGSTIVAEAVPTPSQATLFFVALYIVGMANGASNPNLMSLGGDQLDSPNQISAFFSLYMASSSVGMLLATTVLSYVENEGHWKLGLWVSAGIGVLGFILLLAGMPMTRQFKPGKNAIVSIVRVIAAATLDRKANAECTMEQVVEVKAILRLIPFWVCSIFVVAATVQKNTLFVLQGETMDNRMWGKFNFPPSSMGLFSLVVVIVGAPAYSMLMDTLVSRERRGRSSIIRMGAGLVVAMCTFCVAAVVEVQRLRAVGDTEEDWSYGEKVPMSLFWLVPQFTLDGITTVLFTCGYGEFTYSYSPHSMKGLMLAVSISGYAIGSYLSSFLVECVKSFSSWIPDDLNQGRLDYFYWLLTGALALNFALFVVSSKWLISLQGSESVRGISPHDEENVSAKVNGSVR